jgi:hypothetical protein
VLTEAQALPSRSVRSELVVVPPSGERVTAVRTVAGGNPVTNTVYAVPRTA